MLRLSLIMVARCQPTKLRYDNISQKGVSSACLSPHRQGFSVNRQLPLLVRGEQDPAGSEIRNYDMMAAVYDMACGVRRDLAGRTHSPVGICRE